MELIKATAPDDIVKEVTKRFELLLKIRQPYEPMWDEIINFVTHYLKPINGKRRPGIITGQDQYDVTPLQALNLLSDGLYGYLISPSIRWLSLTLPHRLKFPRWSGMRKWDGKRMDDLPDVKAWLDDTEEVMYSAFNASNFYTTMPNVLTGGGSIGTVDIYTEEDRQKGVAVFTAPHPREVVFSVDVFGNPETVIREYDINLEQMVTKFGLAKMRSVIRGFDEMYRSNPYMDKEVLHAVYPRAVFDPSKRDNINKPWASVWILKSEKKLLGQSGYTRNPHKVWRWRTLSDEWYGRSPAWDCYMEIVKINQTEQDRLDATQMAIRPPWMVPDLMRGKERLTAGATSYYDHKNIPAGSIFPLLGQLDKMPLALADQEASRAIIKEFFHTDFFLMLSQAAMNKIQLTATQVIEMAGEKAAILGVRTGRLNHEVLDPAVDDVFFIEAVAGRIPNAPQILQDNAGVNLEVDYMGPLAQAQRKLFKTQGISATFETLGPLLERFPNMLDNIDEDELFREISSSAGMPARVIRSMEKVQAMREQRVAEAKAAQEQAMMLEASKNIDKMGRPIDQSSILGGMIGAENMAMVQ